MTFFLLEKPRITTCALASAEFNNWQELVSPVREHGVRTLNLGDTTGFGGLHAVRATKVTQDYMPFLECHDNV